MTVLSWEGKSLIIKAPTFIWFFYALDVIEDKSPKAIKGKVASRKHKEPKKPVLIDLEDNEDEDEDCRML